MSEADLEQQVMAEASRRGHRLFKNHIGVARYKRGGRAYAVHYGVGGNNAPDLIGWTASGEFVGIEIKLPGRKPRPGQRQWAEAAKTACPTLRIGWADSVERAMEILEGGDPHTV